MTQKCFYITLLALMLYPAYAQESEPGFWSLQLENDLWGSNDDRFYTHGTKVSFAFRDSPPNFLQSVADNLAFYQQGERAIHGYEIGQAIFTPEDINKSRLIEDDRPYAGWLYFNTGFGHVFEDRGDREKINLFLLTIGIVGPNSFSEDTQESIHSLFDATDPRGWDNQLQDELGLNASYLRKWRRIYNFDEHRQTEVSYHANITLGNVYSYIAAGIVLRYGTHLKADIGPPNILPGFPGAPAFNPNRQSNWYLFAGIEARAIARNIFLDGNTFRDSPSVEKKPLVADIQVGIAYHFSDMRISFTQMFRSKEFEGQEENVQFGAINLTIYTE